jgi:hypothetical protein
MIDARIKWLAFASVIVGSIQLSAPALAQSYARDMFYQELKNPGVTATSNTHHGHASTTAHSSAPSHGGACTGMSFWIELKRNGRISKVDSRHHFKGGDQIKFHIVTNANGYAHIVLLQGTSGSQYVLFPVAGKDPTNQITRGREYEIPKVTYLQFDNTPGREHVRFALTKRDEDSSKFLSPQGSSQVAMASISSNPAIDPTGGKDQIKVSFKEDIPKPVPITRPAVQETVSEPVSPPTNDSAIENAIPDDNRSLNDRGKDLFRNDSGSGGGGGSTASHHSYHPTHRPVRHTVYRPATTYTPPPAPPTTVVLNTNASEDLYVDIALEHD